MENDFVGDIYADKLPEDSAGMPAMLYVAMGTLFCGLRFLFFDFYIDNFGAPVGVIGHTRNCFISSYPQIIFFIFCSLLIVSVTVFDVLVLAFLKFKKLGEK